MRDIISLVQNIYFYYISLEILVHDQNWVTYLDPFTPYLYEHLALSCPLTLE
jgi:hypothetical protein